jgi:hypothetical protein
VPLHAWAKGCDKSDDARASAYACRSWAPPCWSMAAYGRNACLTPARATAAECVCSVAAGGHAAAQAQTCFVGRCQSAWDPSQQLAERCSGAAAAFVKISLVAAAAAATMAAPAAPDVVHLHLLRCMLLASRNDIRYAASTRCRVWAGAQRNDSGPAVLILLWHAAVQ